MKTVRFAQIVAASGQPEPYTLWVPPREDDVLQRAVKQHRVMTVHRVSIGAKKDFGEVGLLEGRETTLLVFPKSIRAFAGKRVIGVNYDLIKTGEAAAPARREPAVRARGKEPKKKKFGPLRVVGHERVKPATPARATAKNDKIIAFDAQTRRAAEGKAAKAAHAADAKAAREAKAAAKRKQSAEKKATRMAKAAAALAPKEAKAAEQARRREEAARNPEQRLASLRQAVTKALKKLQQGQAVAAYQTLETALNR